MTKRDAMMKALEWALSMKRIVSTECRSQEPEQGQEDAFRMWDEMAGIYREIMRDIRFGSGGE